MYSGGGRTVKTSVVIYIQYADRSPKHEENVPEGDTLNSKLKNSTLEKICLFFPSLITKRLIDILC
jgi:hypothetical protein